ncbi:MAG: type III pantothenate kinase [Planctomycetota bacterium]
MATERPPSIMMGIGNTSVHAGLFTAAEMQQPRDRLPQPTWHYRASVDQLDHDPFAACDLPTELAEVVVASVNRDAYARIVQWIGQRYPQVVVRTLQYSDFPVALGQTEPARVGTDRIAAAVAVNALRTQSRAAVFVDAGTALTVNVIDPAGVFLGGAILPGIAVSLSTLSHATDQLPALSFRELAGASLPPVIGRNTEEAMRSGVFWGAVGAIRELSQQMAHQLEAPTELFVTGGFGEPLAAALGGDAPFVPHLVLAGIAMAAGSA